MRTSRNIFLNRASAGARRFTELKPESGQYGWLRGRHYISVATVEDYTPGEVIVLPIC